MKKFKANVGIYIEPNKDDTINSPVEDFVKPEYVYIPLSLRGSDFEVYVKEGDKVKLGQLVAKRTTGLPVTHHATVSGEVVGIERKNNHMGSPFQNIVIKNDFQDTLTDSFKKFVDLSDADNETLSNQLLDGGIVGLGGSGFPSFMKYLGVKNIHTVILNGAECEPYVTADYRAMLEDTKAMFDGLSIMMQAANATDGVIAIKSSYTEVYDVLMKEAVNYPNIRVEMVKSNYPAGWEKSIVYHTTKCTYDRLPLECGVIVNNVQTATSVSRLFRDGVPLIERIITVTGEGMNEKRNLRVRVGTLASEIIEHCGGFNPNLNEIRLVSGGPMMGTLQKNTDYVITKETNGIVVLPSIEVYEVPQETSLFEKVMHLHQIDKGATEKRVVDEQPCVRCMKCVEACPAKIRPTLLSAAALKKDEKRLDQWDVLACINCGACTFVCPSHIPLAANIQKGQAYLKARQRLSKK